jgi:hypothetical protein
LPAPWVETAHSSLRLQPLSASSPQHLNRRIPVDQFSALGLSKACLDMGGDGFALLKHPVFKIELLADNLERLIENLAGVLNAPDRTAKSIARCCSGFRSIVMSVPLKGTSSLPTVRW